VQRSHDRQCGRGSLGAFRCPLGDALEIERSRLRTRHIPWRHTLARRRGVGRGCESGCRRLGATTFERSVLRPLLATRRVARLTATPPSASTRATTGTLATLALGPLCLLCLLTFDRSRRHVRPGRLRRALLLDSLLLRTLLVALRLGLLLVARRTVRSTLALPALGLLLVGPPAALSTLVAALFRTLLVARFRAALTVLALRSTLAVALRALLVPATLVAAPVAPALTPVAGPAAVTVTVTSDVPVRIASRGRGHGLRFRRTLVADEPVPETHQRAIARAVLRNDGRGDGRCHGRYGHWLGCRRGSRCAGNDRCHRRHGWRRRGLFLGGDRIQVHLWLHGHLHCRHDYQVERAHGPPTRVVCQARGLQSKGETGGYDAGKLIEV